MFEPALCGFFFILVPMQTEQIKEKCGVVGIWQKQAHAAYYVKRALSALQHRGQESTGISVINNKATITTEKGMGLVSHVLTDTVLKKLDNSRFAIGHNRYGTTGKSSTSNAQPLQIKQKQFQISIGHNGNIPNLTNIRKKLGERKTNISDTLLMAMLLVKERSNFPTWEKTLAAILPEFRGAYNLVILTNDGTLFGVRDPFGIRPLCLGKFSDGWIIASESVALDAVGAEFIRDVERGEIIKITADGKLQSFFFGEPKKQQICLFEYIYFARPDSFMNGKRVRKGREASGELLGERLKKKKIQPDVVVPTFDSGYPAAKGVARALGIPIVDAITTSHYIGRTFIHPGQDNRVTAVKGKHNITPDEIFGKHVVVVDDSAVRLTTSTLLAREIKAAGAKKVTMAFASPPVVEQCDLGIDMRSKKDLPAARFEKESFSSIEKKVAELIAADEVVYLPIEETAKAFGGQKEDFYYTPFGGPHPLRDKQPPFPKRKKMITGKPRIAVFLSGKGTFMQDIIDTIEQGSMDAEIVGVLANKPDAYGITRAKNHHIPTTIIPFEGKRSDLKARAAYEEKLIKYIQQLQPDVLLLSGWLFILSDVFLNALQRLQIPVINHHPALLSSKAAETIVTSRGRIPVLRGENAWEETFKQKLPVSGISVHQILPGDGVDVGPVIMKAEVRVRPNDTMESWRKRMDETEHLLVPTAMKRILHVMSNNIDISKGAFPW